MGRRIFIGDNIDNRMANEVVEKIFQWNDEDRYGDQNHKNFNPEPIHIMINSNGGSAYDGLSIINAINLSLTPVFTFCIGRAMSMGFFIFLAGDERYAHSDATFMAHDVSWGNNGTITQLSRTVREGERIRAIFDRLVVNKTKITYDKLKEIYRNVDDAYISGDEALELGICDYLMEYEEVEEEDNEQEQQQGA